MGLPSTTRYGCRRCDSREREHEHEGLTIPFEEFRQKFLQLVHTNQYTVWGPVMRAASAGQLAEFLMVHREFLRRHAQFRLAVQQKYESLSAEVRQGSPFLREVSQIKFEQRVRPLLQWLLWNP